MRDNSTSFFMLNMAKITILSPHLRYIIELFNTKVRRVSGGALTQSAIAASFPRRGKPRKEEYRINHRLLEGKVSPVG